MLRCVIRQAIASSKCGATSAATCCHARKVIAKAHHVPDQPQQQPLQPQQQRQSFEEEILSKIEDVEMDFSAHCKDMCQRLDNLIEQQSAMSQKMDDMFEGMSGISKMTKDMKEQLSAISETSCLISGTHPRNRLQLEVGERAGSHGTLCTVPQWLQRLAVPLQAVGIQPAMAQANIIEHLLKVYTAHGRRQGCTPAYDDLLYSAHQDRASYGAWRPTYTHLQPSDRPDPLSQDDAIVRAAMRGLGQRMCRTFSQLMAVDSNVAETAAAAVRLAGAAVSAAGSQDGSLEQLHQVCSVTNISCVQVAMLLKDCSRILI